MEQWRRNLYALWLMQFLALSGTSLVFPFLPFYVRDLGVVGDKAIAQWTGVCVAAAWAFSALFAPIWGSIGDRYGRKLMIIRANLGLAVAIFAMGLVNRVWQLLVLRVLQGCLGGFVPPALALITTSAPKDKTGYALGMIQSAGIGGAFIAPLIGGVLADLIGIRPVFFVTAALMLISGVVVALLVKDVTLDGHETGKSRILPNLRFVASRQPLLAIALIMLLINFSMMILFPVFPLFVESLGTNKATLATNVGALFAITGFFAVVSAPIWGNMADRKGPAPILALSLVASGICFIAQAFVRTVPHLFPLRALLGLFTGGFSPSTQAIVVRNSPDSRRGGVIGIITSVGLIGGSFGPLAGGFLAGVITLRGLFIFTGLTLLLAYLALRRLPQIDPQ